MEFQECAVLEMGDGYEIGRTSENYNHDRSQ